MAAFAAAAFATPAHAQVTCARTIKASVAAIDQVLVYNRLGAQNVNGMMYALTRDLLPGTSRLRPDKRPRPLVLRVAEGECLEVTLTNLLTPVANQNDGACLASAGCNPGLPKIDNQVADRTVGFHVQGLELVRGVEDDSSFVGQNASSLAGGGGTRTYVYKAKKEGAYLVTSYGATFGGEGESGNTTSGLFAVVNVEPKGARAYRSQVTEEELRLATVATVPASATSDPTCVDCPRETNPRGGQPILDYDVRYPTGGVWDREGKGGLPVLAIVDPATNEIVHSDVNAIVIGPGPNGMFPASTYPVEGASAGGKQLQNPVHPWRLRPFREFTVVFHDEQATQQAFPVWYADPAFGFALSNVKDSFMINYGSGGIGSEIIANRLGVGPMHDCLNCAYEEFFLTSFAVGDPAMLVDTPANVGLEGAAPNVIPAPETVGPKALKSFFPDDPSNVHHAYVSDQVKFRNVHAGREHHVFHLHNHQWLYNPNDDDSNYIDAQGLGPGSGYTYEINYGAGNRNRSAGDAIYHCHFYPHFAQGMWAHFRIHDVFEAGTRLAVSGADMHTVPFQLADGTPAPVPASCTTTPPGPDCAPPRALPDPEIVAGTPIPAVVPMPGYALPPMPGRVIVAESQNQAPRYWTAEGFMDPPAIAPVGSNARVLDRAVNPGFPFWVGGIENVVGQRPPTPPLDMISEAQARALGQDPDPLFSGRGDELARLAGGFDGGLPRHALDGYAAIGAVSFAEKLEVAPWVTTGIDFTKYIHKARPVWFPETGTDLERTAMRFHARRAHGSAALKLGCAAGADPATCVTASSWLANGHLPVPSGIFADPCGDDRGNRLDSGVAGQFYAGTRGDFVSYPGSPFHATNPRTYAGANIQIDAILNKVGYHYPQQRIVTLWGDVADTIAKRKAPEPFVIRFNTMECGKFLHTNLVPAFFEADDFQVRTPTDIIGQHIHLPKWDLTTTDGAANGWNYEDGTLSADTVRERIHAINLYNGDHALVAQDHPFFGPGPGGTWKGARTTLQRWFFDPVLNVRNEDRGLGVIFTHDHYGPSTHQQVGLYGSVLTEPAGSAWYHNESGVQLGTRMNTSDPSAPYRGLDGGPTSWQAAIVPPDRSQSFREFWYQASDFQSAYEAGVYIGAGPDGRPNGQLPTKDSFRSAINTAFRKQNDPVLPDLFNYPAFCPGGERPCPEAISGKDPGLFVLNYRNEPIGLRVFDPNKLGPDGKPGMQADGLAGDLAYALQTRTDRAIPALNTRTGNTPYAPLTNDVAPGDPFTPIMRAFAGDPIRIRVQMGGHEEELQSSIHGIKWLQGGSSFGKALNSGWRNAQGHGISEQFTFTGPLTPFLGQGNVADYLYSGMTGHDGLWAGIWGVLRNYNQRRNDLFRLPNSIDVPARIANGNQFSATPAGFCPANAPMREADLTAALANEILDNPLGVAFLAAPGDPLAAANDQHVGAGGLACTAPGVCAPRPGGIQNDANGTGLGGTLVYNPRFTPLQGETSSRSGPLHDPTAILYVRTADLVARDPKDPGCFTTNPVTGVTSFDAKLPTCPVRLAATAQPLVLRAAAGECLEVTLRNRLPGDLDANGFFDDVPDLASLSNFVGVVNRDRGAPGSLQGVTTFNQNLVRPSSHVGLHPQLVAYDVTRADGTNVGRNRVQTAAPGDNVKIRWYMGDVSHTVDARGRVMLSATPIEFGGTNLAPADRIKQGQKALVGTLAIMPQGASWVEDADDATKARKVRTAATVSAPAAGTFRDFTVVLQKQQSMRYADGAPVENVMAEGGLVAEDAQDSGQSAINYGSEPLWYRFNLVPSVEVGNHGPLSMGALPNANMAYSNCLVPPAPGIGRDPATPVFTAGPGEPFRMHVVAPYAGFRGTVFHLHGHSWQRDPYVCLGEDGGVGLPGRCNPGGLGSLALGVNPVGFGIGGQDFIHAQSHFDLVFPKAGGEGAHPGDFLFRDMAGAGNTAGLWGLLRVGTPQGVCAAQ